MKKILVFGSFDLIHPGHIYFLKKAATLGDYLILCLTRDTIYKKQKNHPPLFKEKERQKILESLKYINKVILGDNDLKKIANYNIIKKIKPDIIALGYDQNINYQKLRQINEKIKKEIKIFKIRAYKRNFFSSNKIKSKFNFT